MAILAAVPLLAADSADTPELVPGELEALRAVLDAELEGTTYQRVEIGRFLLVRWDSRREREQLLEGLSDRLPDASDEMIDSFRHRNRSKLALWPAARTRLGERADKNVFLVADPTGVHVQFARVGWGASRRRGLVFLELRPREGSEATRGVFRIVSLSDGGWRAHDERATFERGRF